MRFLTLNEQILLLAIWKLKDDAYPVAIRDQVNAMTGKNIVYGTLYNSLDYLHKKGLVAARKGEPTPERGGKSKVYFSLSAEGIEALHRSREIHDSIWNGVRDLKTSK